MDNKTPKHNKSVIIKIDAKNASIGRLASNVAHSIQGKTIPSFKTLNPPTVKVEIENIHSMKISDKQLNKHFHRYSGYPGGLKTIYWRKLYQENPSKLFIKVLTNMLPANRHKKLFLKNIKFT